MLRIRNALTARAQRERRTARDVDYLVVSVAQQRAAPQHGLKRACFQELYVRFHAPAPALGRGGFGSAPATGGGGGPPQLGGQEAPHGDRVPQQRVRRVAPTGAGGHVIVRCSC
eukprot:TRINITY_DN1786_c1_g1_i1.p1 TRINITY_DN1786_c1_g1~~TRINITY_DN1786_c1_g1_i1.p1  ORF type:complete len:114 (+),score=7.48 TRINITY_DN1786_c1_g1_i1:185-526(+)